MSIFQGFIHFESIYLLWVGGSCPTNALSREILSENPKLRIRLPILASLGHTVFPILKIIFWLKRIDFTINNKYQFSVNFTLYIARDLHGTRNINKSWCASLPKLPLLDGIQKVHYLFQCFWRCNLEKYLGKTIVTKS